MIGDRLSKLRAQVCTLASGGFLSVAVLSMLPVPAHANDANLASDFKLTL